MWMSSRRETFGHLFGASLIVVIIGGGGSEIPFHFLVHENMWRL